MSFWGISLSSPPGKATVVLSWKIGGEARVGRVRWGRGGGGAGGGEVKKAAVLGGGGAPGGGGGGGGHRGERGGGGGEAGVVG